VARRATHLHFRGVASLRPQHEDIVPLHQRLRVVRHESIQPRELRRHATRVANRLHLCEVIEGVAVEARRVALVVRHQPRVVLARDNARAFVANAGARRRALRMYAGTNTWYPVRVNGVGGESLTGIRVQHVGDDGRCKRESIAGLSELKLS